MKIIEKLKTDRKFLLKVVGLTIATLFVPYLTIPGLMIWWFYKTPKISKIVKVIVMGLFGASAILLLVFGIAIYTKDLEPHLTVSEPSGNTKVQSNQITLKGNYDPPDRVVWINNKRIPSTNGSFEAIYDLQEGENKIDVTAGKWKRAHVYLTVIRELTAEEIAAKTTPTSTPNSPTAFVQEPTKAPTAIKQATPIPQPTKSVEAGKPPSIANDVNGFPKNAKQVTVSDIAKTPNVYADGITNVVFTCKILSFARDDRGDATAVNCADPKDISSIVQIDIGNFDIKQINVSDTIRVYGFVMGVFKGKNGFGVEITEAAISGMYINDLTSGYNNTK